MTVRSRKRLRPLRQQTKQLIAALLAYLMLGCAVIAFLAAFLLQ